MRLTTKQTNVIKVNAILSSYFSAARDTLSGFRSFRQFRGQSPRHRISMADGGCFPPLKNLKTTLQKMATQSARLLLQHAPATCYLAPGSARGSASIPASVAPRTATPSPTKHVFQPSLRHSTTTEHTESPEKTTSGSFSVLSLVKSLSAKHFKNVGRCISFGARGDENTTTTYPDPSTSVATQTTKIATPKS